mmetsp:Transcript_35756/g.57875  ORF Transcript_35756/g.57875 Transcript_35756/m.57875 type:complete len:254 (+) Transcript_35756:156-917(+)
MFEFAQNYGLMGGSTKLVLAYLVLATIADESKISTGSTAYSNSVQNHSLGGHFHRRLTKSLNGHLIRFALTFEGGPQLDSSSLSSSVNGALAEFTSSLKKCLSSTALLSLSNIDLRGFQNIGHLGAFLVEVDLWYPSDKAEAAGRLQDILNRKVDSIFDNFPDFLEGKKYGRPSVSGVQVHAVSRDLISQHDDFKRFHIRADILNDFGAKFEDKFLIPKLANPSFNERQHWAQMEGQQQNMLRSFSKDANVKK